MVASNGGSDGNLIRRPYWRPQWPVHRRWARGFVKRNLWRVNRLYTYDEALQECALIFVKCCKHYDGKVTKPALFMALYIKAVTNNFHTFARHNERLTAGDAVAVQQATDQVDYSNGPLFAALNRASAELKDVVVALTQAPSELLLMMLGSVHRGRTPNEEAAISRALCRLARIPNVRSDLLTELRDLLRD